MLIMANLQNNPNAILLAVVVWMALVGACVVSGVCGALIPITLKRLKLDPVIPAKLGNVDVTIRERAIARSDGGEKPTYTQRLLADRNLRLKKIGEESSEFVTACADGDTGRAVEEAADLVYHALVALRALGAGWDDVRAALPPGHRTGRQPAPRPGGIRPRTYSLP